MEYEVVYKESKFWISKNGEILRDIGGFDDPISPKIIIREIEDEI